MNQEAFYVHHHQSASMFFSIAHPARVWVAKYTYLPLPSNLFFYERSIEPGFICLLACTLVTASKRSLDASQEYRSMPIASIFKYRWFFSPKSLQSFTVFCLNGCTPSFCFAKIFLLILPCWIQLLDWAFTELIDSIFSWKKTFFCYLLLNIYKNQFCVTCYIFILFNLIIVNTVNSVFNQFRLMSQSN